MSRRLFLSASIGLVGGCALPSGKTDMRSAEIIKTRLGQVRGVAHGRVVAFLGLRYAAPPTGALRFAPPEPSGPWTGVYDATKLPPRALQGPAPPLVGWPTDTRQDEDCLFLNIYTPAPDRRKRPVLVWIHGGSYTMGSANEYDGSVLAAQGDVVVVCINYRLGVFGFTDLSGLDKRLVGSASNGFRDQIAALAWVRDNIADYGGDPGNVTIFGESAGGGSVLTLLAAPSAEGLFHRAIAHSPGGSFTPPTDDIPTLTKALGVGRDSLLERLRALPAKELLALQLSAGLNNTSTIDGVVITRPYPQAIRERGAGGVPVIAGSNRDEGTFLREVGGVGPGVAPAMAAVTLGGADPTAYLAALKAAYPRADDIALDVLVWNDFFRRPSIRAVQAATEAGPGGWLYRFDLPSSALGGRLGATHGAEIAFTFNAFAASGAAHDGGEGNVALYDGRDPVVRKLAEQWSNTILAFARTGSPNGAGLPVWPKYSNADRASLVIDAESHIARGLDDRHLRLWGDA